MKEEDLIQKYLKGEELSETEQKEFNQRLKESPQLRQELVEQSLMHGLLKGQSRSKSNKGESAHPTPTTQPDKSSPISNYAKAASLFISAGLIIFLLSNSESLEPKKQLEQLAQSPSIENKDPSFQKYQDTLKKLPQIGSMNRPINQKHELAESSNEIDFNRDIRPILSENCYHCHGPDVETREANIALHSFDFATQAMDKKNESYPIVPGKPEQSMVWLKINDKQDPMPPENSNRHLSLREKQLLKKWIEQGAQYKKHWAYQKPQKSSLPLNTKGHPIDAFVERELSRVGLKQQPKADWPIMARRASLVLTGLLPNMKSPTLQQFLESPSQHTYENYLDELLDSYDYAERMTLAWLDFARYSDTDGYSDDKDRSNWPWRDWVIEAFKNNMPYDQFTIEQLAGDLLPNPTTSQIIATTFNRNHRQNNEGAVLAEEFFVENVIDRVETTSAVWLGLTMGCARCHDHKYDEITQKEFYQFYAYFNNIGEVGKGMGRQAKPLLETHSLLTEKLHPELYKQLLEKEASLKTQKTHLEPSFQQWFKKLTIACSSNILPHWEAIPQAKAPFQFEPTTKAQSLKMKWAPKQTEQKSVAVKIEIELHPIHANQMSSLSFSDLHLKNDQPLRVLSAHSNHADRKHTIDMALDGKHSSFWKKTFPKGKSIRKIILTLPLQQAQVLSHLELELKNVILNNAHMHIKPSLSQNAQFEIIAKGLLSEKEASTLSKGEHSSIKERIRQRFLSMDSDYQKTTKEIQHLNAKLADLGFPKVPLMVMQEQETITPAYLLRRGLYDKFDKNKPLQRSIPAIFTKPGMQAPKDRLELARWLVSKDNPITARVTINHFWQIVFGRGLVKTSEDFGVQGSLPTHPELLDWLAVDFIDSKWNIKRLLKLILTSQTFQKSSIMSARQFEVDPDNQHLSRGPRYRLNGFAIRDKALQAAGLLNTALGGAPVKPYQPAGLWVALAEGGRKYTQDVGEKLYRKSLYTFSKRTITPPRHAIFDAVSREVCSVTRQSTNTPLQALTLMNDPTFLEAANHLGQRMLLYTSKNLEEKLSYGYKLGIGLTPKQGTLEVLKDNYHYFLGVYTAKPEMAIDLLNNGSKTLKHDTQLAELASFAATAHLILNLDEAIVIE